MRRALLLLMLIPYSLSAQISNFQWPLAPVNEQHRISATFDECREDRDHFHNGTDMPLAPGGEALSIMAGTVGGIGTDWIRVGDFAYVHVNPNPAYKVGNSVAKGAVVGWADSYAHIHLNYGWSPSYGNPLLPGKITPFEDPYHPRSPIIQLVRDGSFTAFPDKHINGRVDIVAQAADTTDLASNIDKNNGIYKIGWALYSADTSTVVEGPYFWFEAKQKYYNQYINNVYAPGSSTSIYKYIVTNKIAPTSYANGYLDCTQHTPGDYVISVMSVDTRDNWDTTYVAVTISDEDVLPPGQPKLNYVGADINGDLRFEWTPPTDSDLAGYILEHSADGIIWNSNYGPDVLTAGMTSFSVPGFTPNSYLHFRLKAIDSAPIPNYSKYSDTYAVRLNNNADQFLIVDGFDRSGGSWKQSNHNFATYVSDAIVASGSRAAITTVNNEWVLNKGSLANYGAVLWVLGDESTADETFSSAEQNLVSSYLAGGGKLFVSGSEIAWDLGSQGSTTDKNFLSSKLRLSYAGDASDSYHVNGAAGHFSGLSFNYGSSPYPEDYPDYFTPQNGGEVVLKYGNGRNAAIGYRDGNSASLVLGFPFETIDTAENRLKLMDHVLRYFGTITDVDEPQTPLTFSISDIYPNPFNASVNVNYQLSHEGNMDLSIYDIRGRKVFERQFQSQQAGSYSWNWAGVDQSGKSLSSGMYLIRLDLNGQQSVSGKLLLLK